MYIYTAAVHLSSSPRQLATETRLFLQADKFWREVLRLIADKPTALKAVTTPGMYVCNVTVVVVDKQTVLNACSHYPRYARTCV